MILTCIQCALVSVNRNTFCEPPYGPESAMPKNCLLMLTLQSGCSGALVAAQPDCKVSISKQFFGMADSGPYGGSQKVFRFTLTNAHCMQAVSYTHLKLPTNR